MRRVEILENALLEQGVTLPSSSWRRSSVPSVASGSKRPVSSHNVSGSSVKRGSRVIKGRKGRPPGVLLSPEPVEQDDCEKEVPPHSAGAHDSQSEVPRSSAGVHEGQGDVTHSGRAVSDDQEVVQPSSAGVPNADLPCSSGPLPSHDSAVAPSHADSPLPNVIPPPLASLAVPNVVSVADPDVASLAVVDSDVVDELEPIPEVTPPGM